jgi:Ca2+/Na+ antiporter
MAIPLSILIFSDIVIFQNKLYSTLHILLVCIYFVTLYLFAKLSQQQTMQAEIETIPSAPIMLM